MATPFRTLISFQEVTEIVVDIAGCKPLLRYTDATGKHSVELKEGVKNLVIETGARKRGTETARNVKFGQGNIQIRGIKG
jgi:hypothetical protein